MIFRNWVLQNFPFLEDDFDALTDYELFCKMIEYMRKSLDKINDYQNELNSFRSELDSYKNYFDNLDVQEEINNKLDEMAESGELTDIIAQYLQLAGVLAFNTLDDLENAENIANGSICLILGKDTYNDGKSAYYKIREILNTDVIDGDNIIAIVNDNNLVGEKIPKYDIEEIDTRLDTLEDTVVTSVAGAPNLLQVYVDATNGDDTKDGKTTANRMKTLEAIFNKYVNKGETVIRIIFYPGTYNFNKYAINSCTMHFGIKGDTTGNITINFANPNYDGTYYNDIPFYNSHFNITGNSSQKFILNGGTACTKLYLDGGSILLQYVDITNMTLANYGAYIAGDYVTIPQLFAKGGNVILDNTPHIGLCEFYDCVVGIRQATFMCDTQVSSSLGQQITSVNTSLLIYGSTYCDLTNAPIKNNFMLIQGGSLTLRAGINKTGSNTFIGNSRFEGATLRSNQARYTNFKALTTSISFDDDCITSNITL